MAVEDYRDGALTPDPVGRLVGLSFWDTEAFLKPHRAYQPYDEDDVEQDGRDLDRGGRAVSQGIIGSLMATKTLDEHIEVTPDTAGGKPRIRGHRITVQDIAIWHERLGKSADEIASEYDLTLGDVHAALAYYFDHREQIDARMAEDRAFADALRAQIPSKRSQKLRSLRGEN